MVFRRKKSKGFGKSKKRSFAKRKVKRAPRRRDPGPAVARYITSAAAMTMAPRPSRLLPPKMRARLRYSGSSVTATAVDVPITGLYTYSFRGNGVFDPDKTGTGHQPRGYDQYAALYQYVTVTASHINVTFNQFGTDNEGLIWGVFPQPGAASVISKKPLYGEVASVLYTEMLTAAQAPELPGIKTVFCPTDSTNNVSTIKYSQKTSQVIDIIRNARADLGSAVGSTPTAGWLWTIFVGTMSTAASSDCGRWHCTITYDCEFTDPIALAQS